MVEDKDANIQYMFVFLSKSFLLKTEHNESVKILTYIYTYITHNMKAQLSVYIFLLSMSRSKIQAIFNWPKMSANHQ